MRTRLVNGATGLPIRMVLEAASVGWLTSRARFSKSMSIENWNPLRKVYNRDLREREKIRIARKVRKVRKVRIIIRIVRIVHINLII
jgi:hypothetical protein